MNNLTKTKTKTKTNVTCQDIEQRQQLLLQILPFRPQLLLPAHNDGSDYDDVNGDGGNDDEGSDDDDVDVDDDDDDDDACIC